VRPRTSIRLRLTLSYAAVLLITLGLTALGVYAFASSRLKSMASKELESGYATVEDVLRISGGDIYDVYHLGQAKPLRLSRGGQVLYRTETWDQLGLGRERDNEIAGPHGTTFWESPDDRLYQLKTGSVDEFGYEIEFAQDVTAAHRSVEALATVLLTGVPVAFVLSLIGGHILAGRALAPINDIVSRAREITAENLSKRLPVGNPNDELGRLALVFNDTLARLERSFEQLRSFTADAAHELRTPLTSIRTVGEVALRGRLDAGAGREAIGSMLEETDRLRDLLTSMLALASGEAGKVTLKPELIDLRTAVSAVLDELSVLAEEKNQDLSLMAGAPVSAAVDPATLRQAITNVVHNAIRYTPAGGRIEVRVARDNNAQVIIETRDSGPGIPEPERSKVFDRFYRIDKARSRAQGGAGLGLAIAKWAVEANQGTIGFVGPEGSGACCRIILPAPPKATA
jgi:heavy metal sensor kinase